MYKNLAAIVVALSPTVRDIPRLACAQPPVAVAP